RSINKEADEAGNTGPYEEAIDVGDMIADEQGWPLRRDIFPTYQADAIERMHEYPAGQADESCEHLTWHGTTLLCMNDSHTMGKSKAKENIMAFVGAAGHGTCSTYREEQD